MGQLRTGHDKPTPRPKLEHRTNTDHLNNGHYQ